MSQQPEQPKQPPPQYPADELRRQQEEEQQIDMAAGAVAAVLVPLFMGYLTANGVSRGTMLLSQRVTKAALSPVLTPLGLFLMYEIVTRAARVGLRRGPVEPSEIEKRIDETVKDVLGAYEPFDSKTKTATKAALEKYMRSLSETIVTSFAESVKADAAASTGLDAKQWVTRKDDRVRSSHVVLEGEVQRIGQPFVTIGGALQHPGDRTAPLQLWINCRCSLRYDTMENLNAR
jgi:hypothetical protein